MFPNVLRYNNYFMLKILAGMAATALLITMLLQPTSIIASTAASALTLGASAAYATFFFPLIAALFVAALVYSLIRNVIPTSIIAPSFPNYNSRPLFNRDTTYHRHDNSRASSGGTWNNFFSHPTTTVTSDGSRTAYHDQHSHMHRTSPVVPTRQEHTTSPSPHIHGR